MSAQKRILAQGKFLQLVTAQNWEYADRIGSPATVGVVAMTADRRVLLITQYRIPVGKVCVEIPAGLVGDARGQEAEHWRTAALRELREETGYAADDVELLTEGGTSAGMVSECMKLVRAIGVKKAGAQQPDGDEQITLHEVPLDQADEFLSRCANEGMLIDPKVYAALYFLKHAPKPR